MRSDVELTPAIVDEISDGEARGADRYHDARTSLHGETEDYLAV